MIKICEERYFKLVDELIELNFQMMILGIPPTSICEGENPEYPKVGNVDERTLATIAFNKLLAIECKKRNIKFTSIFNYVVDADFKMVKYYFVDCLHYSIKALPFIFDELDINIIWKINLRITIVKFKIKSGLKKLLFLLNIT